MKNGRNLQPQSAMENDDLPVEEHVVAPFIHSNSSMPQMPHNENNNLRTGEIENIPLETPDDGDSEHSQEEFKQLSKMDVLEAFHRLIEQSCPSVQSVTFKSIIGRDSEDISSSIASLVEAFKLFMKRITFFAVITLYGKVRYMLENYQHLVSLMQDRNSSNVLPCRSTIGQSIFPVQLGRVFMRPSISSFPVKNQFNKYI